jgi:hypothetical protein
LEKKINPAVSGIDFLKTILQINLIIP